MILNVQEMVFFSLNFLVGWKGGGNIITPSPLGGPLDPSPLFTETIFPRKDLLPAKKGVVRRFLG